MQTDIQLEKQPVEYSASIPVSVYHSLKSFLRVQDISFSDSNGLFKIIPKDEEQANLVKRFCKTRHINLSEALQSE